MRHRGGPSGRSPATKTADGRARGAGRSASFSNQKANMAQGKIKKWNSDRGFGFIQPEGGGADVFVHASAFEKAGLDAPKEGDRVSYDVKTDRRSGKTAAANIKRG